MKYFLLIVVLFCFWSCDIQYDGETKLQISGKLIDKSGNQLSGKNISINVTDDGSLNSGFSEDLISYGVSDENGLFTFLIPAPFNDNQISLTINGASLLEKSFLFKKKNFKNFKLDFQNILLTYKSEITNLKIILKKVSTNKEIFDISIEANQYQKIIALNSDLIAYQLDGFLDYVIFKNQNVVLNYKIRENNIITNFSENILISDLEVEKTITY